MSVVLDLEPVKITAARHGLTTATIRTAIRDGRIRGVEVAGRYLADPEHADKVLTDCPDRRYTRTTRSEPR